MKNRQAQIALAKARKEQGWTPAQMLADGIPAAAVQIAHGKDADSVCPYRGQGEAGQ